MLGKFRYVLDYGILLWGIPTGLCYAVLTTLTDNGFSRLAGAFVATSQTVVCCQTGYLTDFITHLWVCFGWVGVALLGEKVVGCVATQPIC